MENNYEIEKIEQEVTTLVEDGTNRLIEIENQVSIAKKNASKALEKAEKTKGLQTKVVLNKESIESLKETTTDLAEALVVTTDAQTKMQEYQKTLTNFTKELFKLSILSVAAGDAAIERLKEIVNGNKSKQIGQETKNQIDLIIRQIKDQQSLISKIDEANTKLNKQQKTIDELSSRIDCTKDNKKPVCKFKVIAILLLGLALVLSITALLIAIFK